MTTIRCTDSGAVGSSGPAADRGARRRRGLRSGVALALAAVLGLGTASSARAAFAIEPGSFVAGAYRDQAETIDETQAGAVPFQASTSFDLTTHVATGPGGQTIYPDANLKRSDVDLPAGLAVNPEATPKCSRDHLATANANYKFCPPSTQVGTVLVRLVSGMPGNLNHQRYPVYNMVPRDGDTADFAFAVVGYGVTHVLGSVRGDDFGLRAVVDNISSYVPLLGVTLTLWGVPMAPAHDPLRDYFCFGVSCNGAAVGVPSGAMPKALLRTPTLCDGHKPTTRLAAFSWQRPNEPVQAEAESPVVDGCEQLTFSPAVDVTPDVSAPDSPTGLDVDIRLPQQDDPNLLGAPDLKAVTVTLPEGMTINPSAASGLEACDDAALGLGTDAPLRCPEAAKIGTVEAMSPLVGEKLSGGVYIRQQASADPASGEMFRLALVLASKKRGLSIRIPGAIVADPATGRLTATFDNNPQLPVSNVKLHLKSGPRAPLATPKQCGPHRITTTITSWAGHRRDLTSTFQVACLEGLGGFAPGFSAGTTNPAAGASSPFALRVAKPDGQSDLNGVTLDLPDGLLGNLRGNVGTQVGTARVAAGPGSSPFWLSGPVYLEGAYGDAPFSLRVVVPAVAGPFDLGVVEVRQKLYVDPRDAHVTVVSDPLPTIVSGVPVRLQSLAVDIDKPGFMRNPTGCDPKAVSGTLGAATGQTISVSSRFQVGGCRSLPLEPKMSMRLIGKKQISWGKHPTLSTTLQQAAGESALRKVRVRLPLALALDPDNAKALCTPEQAAAKACPAGSIVGKAVAETPILDRPLTGDVFFVEGTRTSDTGRVIKTLPKLWIALRGQVAIDLWADSDVEGGKYLVTTFGFVPDAPISTFRLDIDGGTNGILRVTGDRKANLCRQRLTTDATYDGHSGKQVKARVAMAAPCGYAVREKELTRSHARVVVSGLGAGTLSIKGAGIHRASRVIKGATVATIKPRLSRSGERAYRAGRAVRLRVSFKPKAKKAKTRTKTVAIKRTRKG